MGFIYPVMFELEEFAADSKQTDADVAAFLKHLSQCIEQRWTHLHNDYHAAAYALNPRYWDFGAHILANSEVMGGLHRTLRKLCSGPGETAQAIDEFSGLCLARKGTFEVEGVLAAAKFTHKPIHRFWEEDGQCCGA
jgi:DNA-binding IclR family transcriptional regulator